MVKKVLENIGLSKKEVEVYLTLLPLGNVPASILGKRINMPRSTAKFTCEQLVKKGLIQETVKNNASIYIAEPPEKIYQILNNRKKEISKKEESLNQVMGDLSLMYNPGAALPKIRLLTSKEEVMGLLDEIVNELSSGDELLSFVRILEDKRMAQSLEEYIKDFVKKRVAKNISTRTLAMNSKSASKLKRLDKKELRKTRIATIKNVELYPGEIFIVKNKIYTISLKDSVFFGYVVENEVLSQMYRALFEIAWKASRG